jgi:hypothetical protein
MLFEFGKTWKSIAFLIGSWASYGIFGFEFTAITCLKKRMNNLNQLKKLKYLAAKQVKPE